MGRGCSVLFSGYRHRSHKIKKGLLKNLSGRVYLPVQTAILTEEARICPSKVFSTTCRQRLYTMTGDINRASQVSQL
jgi:hypothetical protein